MKLTKKSVGLICKLENIIGKQCYNPNSYDGYTMIEGLSYRYPVDYINKDGEHRRSKIVIPDIDKTMIGTMKYKFGSNHLYIGDGIVKCLEYLEEEFDINFDELLKEKKGTKK